MKKRELAWRYTTRILITCPPIVERLTQHARGLQRPTWLRRTAMVVARAALLDIRRGDPWIPTHPARQVLTRRVPGAYEVADRHERHLLLVDYQLAAVRHRLGLHPRDDWYAVMEDGPGLSKDHSPGPAVDLHQRGKAVWRSLRTASRYATEVDFAFQCDWRTQEVQERVHRLRCLLGSKQLNPP